MQSLSDPRVIRAIMSRYGFRISKSLGQNFIVNPEICPKIAELGGANPETGVLEIGPGIGVLTAELAKRAKKVVAVEIDARLLPVLSETLAEFENVTVINGDVLKLDLRALLAEHFSGMDVVVCANLPYYITSPIVMALLEARLPVKSVTVMVQKEAALRIAAKIPSREVGAVTVAVQWYSKPKLLFDVTRESFLPPPDVTSSVIRLDIREKPPIAVKDETMLFRVVKGAFSQRRKTVLNCLASFFHMDKPGMERILVNAGVSPSARAEQLEISEFAAIADALFE